MKRVLVIILFLFLSIFLLAEEDLPPEILVDQYIMLANKCLKMSDYINAAENIDKAVALNVELPKDFPLMRSRVYLKLGRLDEAKAILIKYIKTAEKGSEGYKQSMSLLIETQEAMKNPDAFPLKPEEIKKLKENLKVVFVEGGNKKLGEQNKEVYISSFYITNCEITQIEYKEFMGNNPSSVQGEFLPVENVNWYDAIKYCNARSIMEELPVAYNTITGELLDKNGNPTRDVTKVLGYRLPTEYEWEYAAKGGKNGRPFIYSGSSSIDDVCWCKQNSGRKLQKVGVKKPNELGIYDMSGNVWEWCHDWDEMLIFDKGGNNPIGPDTGNARIRKGGSWDNDASLCTTISKLSNSPSFVHNTLGFRCVRSANK